MADVLPMRKPAPSLLDAVDAFLAQPDLAPTSRRSYGQTTGRLIRAFGPEQLLGELVPSARRGRRGRRRGAGRARARGAATSRRSPLSSPSAGAAAALATAVVDRGLFRLTCAGLAVLAVAYLVASAVQLPLGGVAVGGASMLTVLALAARNLQAEGVRAHVSLSLFVYVAGLLILVRGIEAVDQTIDWYRRRMNGYMARSGAQTLDRLTSAALKLCLADLQGRGL